MASDFVARIRRDCVLLGRSLQDLETTFWIHGVGAIRAPGNLLAIRTVAERLWAQSAMQRNATWCCKPSSPARPQCYSEHSHKSSRLLEPWLIKGLARK